MNPRIVIVEDEGLIALHLSELLVQLGFEEPAIFSSGEDLLAYLARSPPPDAILMDIGLAGTLDGIGTARRVRESMPAPVIFLSAYSDAEKIARASEIPSVRYLVKPVSVEDLKVAIQSVIFGEDGGSGTS